MKTSYEIRFEMGPYGSKWAYIKTGGRHTHQEHFQRDQYALEFSEWATNPRCHFPERTTALSTPGCRGGLPEITGVIFPATQTTALSTHSS